ncbi:MaoC/PaaZ C-terminal domain-containing protein [Ferrovibrio sp.]|uniref:MaoC/PaaZ C-terminal domain-containing protein n=1 Tax=Ferrovibrio sp. TaxID=1917215 RepID=UPI000CB6331B|nr:MaoC/PaaZ C-terminal domain-containing protein [Ferrovibrio sp.]PJI38756.1 MAG: 3-alpha,7-alpha,12-alpha-trihydroxy-5-beta-cholest-24-enoyl-CoA hydratase [Ferrovibrio sp.]
MFSYENAISRQFPEREFTYTKSDTMLYALGIGVGLMDGDPHAIRYLYEKGLRAIPSQTTVVAWEDTWLEDIEADLTKVVHGEQRITLHQALPTSGRIRSQFAIRDIFDKGAGKGAIILAETKLFDAGSGAHIATNLSSVFARGNGGCGGQPGPVPPMHPVPTRAADKSLVTVTTRNQAALYRLSGDMNPLHIDQGFAASAGFDRPILHGLCIFGMATYALIRMACDGDAGRVRHIEMRFSAPFFPGESLRTELWEEDGRIAFRCVAEDREAVVLDRGSLILR